MRTAAAPDKAANRRTRCAQSLLTKLHAVQLRIGALSLKQFGVLAAFDDAAVLHHRDPSAFSIVDRRCAITSEVRSFCNSSSAARMARSDSVSSAEVASSGSGSGSRAVTHARWRYADVGRRTALRRSHRSPYRAVLHLVDEVHRVRHFGRFLNLLAAVFALARIGDVIGDSVVEQMHVLRDQRHLITQ